MSDQIEEWRDVVGYEGLYQVSNLGRIKNVWCKRKELIGKILKPSGTRYPHLTLHKDSKKRSIDLHILVARAFLGPCPVGYTVNHANGIKHDCASSNLEYRTHQENVLHARDVLGAYIGDRNGARTKPERHCRGSSSPNTNITECDVSDMRNRYAAGDSPGKLHKEYGIGKSTFWRIIRKVTWKHVP